MKKEAEARIKINKLLEESGWRFFDDEHGRANIILENHIKITQKQLDEYGNNFEKLTHGFVDFLLLDENGFPLVILEAKSENINPLMAKEQARKYALSQHVRFIILTNGNLHYFWDIESGNPAIITKFPTVQSLQGQKEFKPNRDALAKEPVTDDFIAVTQNPFYIKDPRWKDEKLRKKFIEDSKLVFLRPFQLKAVKSIQQSVKDGKDRFLFEMATGTGKTLTAAAIIKLFLRTGNCKRVLFLVDRIELENQAWKNFKNYLKNDYQTVIYKENRDDWRKAEIVVTTIQSLLADNKYKRLFSPTDFDLIISDEAHRSIGGNSRAVFEYFIGYKLGLTATPKDYLKKFKSDTHGSDPREYERRLLLDTYKTFGCETGEPTFRYSLIDGVNDGYLINPIIVDARTDITTELLSEEGYAVTVASENEESKEKEVEELFFNQKDFEKKFFSSETNRIICKTFIDNALRDPISGEIGKSIVFCVSQNHAAKITQMLNEYAHYLFPGKYNSDFAVQVTSRVDGAQTFTINFSNNNLNGNANFIDNYKTSKTRICVTVGMMTTGYDCQDILNLAMLRPIFSPTDFIQIKGRGTRKYSFTKDLHDEELKKDIDNADKVKFKLFDFFANCEYFEEKFNYDEVIKLPQKRVHPPPPPPPPPPPTDFYENTENDTIKTLKETEVGKYGMKIDRMLFNRFKDTITANDIIQEQVNKGNIIDAEEYIKEHIFDKPEDYYNLDKLRKALKIDRRITLREIIRKIFMDEEIMTKDELAQLEFDRFVSIYKPDYDEVNSLKYFFNTYLTDDTVRAVIEKKNFSDLNVNPAFNFEDYKAIDAKWRALIPEYIKDYVPLNQFMN